ncbi:hypothetical protein AALP_AA6G107600 [Arabis alpina]|uniref:Uncharacterized protein n=1 Tax=Arabis alpina TaxID=50452 RepID=A0A087GNF1_ARAAL|nr:hypothetical protein AALP_AA6G107600 [Arabis alpina]
MATHGGRTSSHEQPQVRTRRSHHHEPIVPIGVVDLQVPLFRGEPRVITTRRPHPQGTNVPARVVDFHVPVSRGEPPVPTRRSHSLGTAVARVRNLQGPVSRGGPRVTTRRSDSRGAILPARVEERMSRGELG